MSIKLTDLDPHWYCLEAGGEAVGISFECPHCRKTRLGVAFHHRGREAMEDAYIMAHSHSTNHIWTLDGDNFENLSLTPSVDASAMGHWHGWIKNGEVT